MKIVTRYTVYHNALHAQPKACVQSMQYGEILLTGRYNLKTEMRTPNYAQSKQFVCNAIPTKSAETTHYANRTTQQSCINREIEKKHILLE